MSNPAPTNPATDPGQNLTPPASGNGGTPPPAATPPAAPLTMTQAELDALIRDRLERQQRAIDAKTSKDRADAEAAKLAEQGEFKKLAETAQQEAAVLKAQLAARDHADLQRAVAAEHKLPPEMAARLQGETRDALVADAKELAKHLAPPIPPPPFGATHSPRPAGRDPQADADQLKNELLRAGHHVRF